MPTLLGITESSPETQTSLDNSGGLISIRDRSSKIYTVLADTVNDTAETVKLTTGIPRLGAIVDGAFVISLRPKEVKTVVHPTTGVRTILWEIRVRLDSNFDASGSITGGTPDNPDIADPLDIRPKAKWSTETEDEVVTHSTLTKRRITNTVGEPILVTRRRHIPVLTIERYEEYPFDPNTLLIYPERVNTKEFWGAPPGSALLSDIFVEERPIRGKTYVYVTYRIKFRITEEGLDLYHDPEGLINPENTGWFALPLNEGTRFRKMIGGTLSDEVFPAQDAAGNPITVNLTRTGELLPDGTDPVHLVFGKHLEADFTALQIDYNNILSLI